MFKNTFKKTKYISIPVTDETFRDEPLPGQISCPSCHARISELDMIRNHKVCPKCNYHYTLTAWERITLTVDENSFREFDSSLKTINPLDFPGYDEKLDQAKQKSGLQEGIITGQAAIDGNQVVIGVMDSRFMMGSMGSVVGEKITRAIETAIKHRCPLIMFTTSGGARMQEGMLSLMQMAKTSAAIARFHQAGLLYIIVLTDPTTGGVTASFASLGDIIIAEPGALVGFAGRRVIKQTIGQQLPDKFQRAEFLLEHGMVDLVVNRSELRNTLTLLLRLHQEVDNG
ncbi:MAG TPA: acetyl-CoA carboxylase, carboxyltransferase subunit beta [Syntrophomonadaceae bacterium]|nr:acetyl-CoA carboxylase, carboxyltransferase subunit beta [Syntrophomonadaceae bacterium]